MTMGIVKPVVATMSSGLERLCLSIDRDWKTSSGCPGASFVCLQPLHLFIYSKANPVIQCVCFHFTGGKCWYQWDSSEPKYRHWPLSLAQLPNLLGVSALASVRPRFKFWSCVQIIQSLKPFFSTLPKSIEAWPDMLCPICMQRTLNASLITQNTAAGAHTRFILWQKGLECWEATTLMRLGHHLAGSSGNNVIIPSFRSKAGQSMI